MRSNIFRRIGRNAAAFVLLATAWPAFADPSHAIAMYGDAALPPDFVSLPYANPDAPKGGRMVVAETGTFDSLNPYVQNGRVPWQLSYLIGESLMGRSLDEPFSLYGLLAESVETSPNRDWVEFTLRPEAKFSDGTPVTVDDVIWSYETLATKGHGRYASFWSKVANIESPGPGKVRITFNTEDRELALLAGLRPILKKAQYEGQDFTKMDGFDHIPITSSPYTITSFEPGRSIEFSRNPDYWGKDVPFRRGTFNLDTYRIEFFGEETATFEAFKTGISDFAREFNAARWDSQYDFPRAQAGEITKETFSHHRPTGMTGFVMNTRRTKFADWRVREALIDAFNYEFINDTITGGAQPRITSYFSNSPLGMDHGPATGRVAELLTPFKPDLLPGALEGYSLPEGDGSERNRANITRAADLLAQAGWTVQDGVRKNAAGEPFEIEMVLQQGAQEPQSMIDIYAKALERLGIKLTTNAVDPAQYRQLTDTYDFDMTYFRRGLSLSPGNEQNFYWGSANADTPGGRNLMGVRSPAVDAMVSALLTSSSQTDFLAATQALDRVLMAGRYVIPIYQWNISRLAYNSHLHHPAAIPLFGDWPGWQPDVWWWED